MEHMEIVIRLLVFGKIAVLSLPNHYYDTKQNYGLRVAGYWSDAPSYKTGGMFTCCEDKIADYVWLSSLHF